MRTLAVIPARLGSTRLPRKPLQLLAGLPLVVRVWQRVAELALFDTVVVATESDEVASVAAAHGATVEMTPESCASGTERAVAVLQQQGASYDVVVNVQGDEPFVSRRALVAATALVTTRGFQIGTAAVLAPPDVLADPNVVKVVTAWSGQAMYFSRAPIPFLRDTQDADLLRSHVHQHIGVYAYDAGVLMRWNDLPRTPLEQIERLEQLRPLTAGIAIGVALIDEPVRPGIDTKEELERANREWAAFTALSTG